MTLNCWELLRALGAVATDPACATALDLPPCGTAEHSEVFAFNCPPYASAYLGDDSARLAAFWTAIGLDVPAEPDHLSTLLDLYARLGEAGADRPLSGKHRSGEHCSGSTYGPGCPPTSAPSAICRPGHWRRGPR